MIGRLYLVDKRFEISNRELIKDILSFHRLEEEFNIWK